MGFSQPLTGSVGCETCPSGTYSERGQTKCEEKCGIGTYRAQTDYPAWFVDSCEICRQYDYAAWFSDSCAHCRKANRGDDLRVADRIDYLRIKVEGTEQVRQPEELCLECPKGYVNSEEGQGQCQICEPGMFQNEPQAEECKNCEKGFFFR